LSCDFRVYDWKFSSSWKIEGFVFLTKAFTTTTLWCCGEFWSNAAQLQLQIHQKFLSVCLISLWRR
jgi:hypothetical protein